MSIYPDDTVKIPLGQDRVILQDPLEALLVRRVVKAKYAEPVTFRSWLEARADEDSPTGDLARDLAAVSSPWASALDIKKIVCPEGSYKIDETTGGTEPCPTTDKHHLDHLIDAAEREFLDAVGSRHPVEIQPHSAA